MGVATAIAVWIASEMRALAPAYATELKVVLPRLIQRGVVVLGAGLLGLLGASLAVRRELRRFAKAS
jgi:cell division protein FtsX